MRGIGSVRRLLVTATVAGVVAAGIGGISLAHAGRSSSDWTMTLTAKQTGSVFVDISHTSQGAPGDESIVHFAMSKSGHKVGSLDAVCTLVLGNQLQCQGVYHLPGGTLTGTTMFPANTSGPKTIAINGGSGRYDRAAGQVNVIPGKTKGVSTQTFDIDS
jgi:hypothetical protein